MIDKNDDIENTKNDAQLNPLDAPREFPREFPRDSMVHYRHLSWRTKLGESKSSLILIAIVASLSFFASIVGAIFGPSIAHTFGPAMFFVICLIIGGGIGIGGVVAISTANQKIFGRNKTLLNTLEEKAISGSKTLSEDETHQLIDRSLKLKHHRVADFYSQQLMALSLSNPNDIEPEHNWMVATDCWASTDRFNKQWVKKLWMLYETRGVLTLSPRNLQFQSKKFVFECRLSQITRIDVKTHSLWLKPMPCKYIYLTIDDSGSEHSFIITPSFAVTDTVWQGNKLVDQWVERLDKVRGI